MDENERIKESIKNMTFLQKMQHIWFYYKWFILFGLLIVVSVLVCLIQCNKREDPDAMIMYAGPKGVTAEYYEYAEKALCEIMSEDYNGDGRKHVDTIQIILPTGESADNSVDDIYSYMTKQENNRERFQIELHAGSSVIYLIDKDIYKYDSMKEFLVPLDYIFDEIPDGAVDEYGIMLSSLPCYKNTDLRYFSPNAVLCIRSIRTKSSIKGNDDNEYYTANLNFFKDIVNWSGANK